MLTLMKLYNMNEAALHNTPDDCWVIIEGRVSGVPLSYPPFLLILRCRWVARHVVGRDVKYSSSLACSTECLGRVWHLRAACGTNGEQCGCRSCDWIWILCLRRRKAEVNSVLREALQRQTVSPTVGWCSLFTMYGIHCSPGAVATNLSHTFLIKRLRERERHRHCLPMPFDAEGRGFEPLVISSAVTALVFMLNILLWFYCFNPFIFEPTGLSWIQDKCWEMIAQGDLADWLTSYMLNYYLFAFSSVIIHYNSFSICI
jgi:hypothetical protein